MSKCFSEYTGKTFNGKLKYECLNQYKNNDIIIQNISYASGNKYWFTCDNCRTDFKSSIIKNGNITPNNVTISSNKIYWFYCNMCKSEFDKKISDITQHNGWCKCCIDSKIKYKSKI
jgi:hypothetical protein